MEEGLLTLQLDVLSDQHIENVNEASLNIPVLYCGYGSVLTQSLFYRNSWGVFQGVWLHSPLAPL